MATNPFAGPINSQLPITAHGELPNPVFIQQLNQALQALQAAQATLQTAQAQLADAQAATQIAQQTTNAAPPPPGASTGNATLTLSPTSGTWTAGPVVTLGALGASAFSANVLLGPFSAIEGGESESPSPFAIIVAAAGKYRIQEIIGASETTVYASPIPGFTCYETATFGTAGANFYVANNAQSDLAAFSSARGAGSVSYRLDLWVTAPATQIDNLVAYLFVKRG